jgi:hypothetical protein
VVAGRTLLLSRQGTQQGTLLWMLLFALDTQPLILRVQPECGTQPLVGRRCTLVVSFAELAKAISDSQGRRAEVLLFHRWSVKNSRYWSCYATTNSVWLCGVVCKI